MRENDIKDLTMKNELGIEVCCKNCTYHCIYETCSNAKDYIEDDYSRIEQYQYCNDCIHKDLAYFCPSYLSLQERIKQLQKVMREEADAIDIGVSALNKYHEEQIQRLEEQQFTKEELLVIKQAISDYSEMSDFDYKPIWDKLEMIGNDYNIIKQ